MPSTALPLDQQLVIVTGASRGLGAAIARAFLREGARVVVNYLNSEAAARELAATAPDRALAARADVRD
ncbi:short-chain dehydrogenase/reductase SDR, partial [Achromobacter xylosoxidans C54]